MSHISASNLKVASKLPVVAERLESQRLAPIQEDAGQTTFDQKCPYFQPAVQIPRDLSFCADCSLEQKNFCPVKFVHDFSNEQKRGIT
jgi:hypothetical protein